MNGQYLVLPAMRLWHCNTLQNIVTYCNTLQRTAARLRATSAALTAARLRATSAALQLVLVSFAEYRLFYRALVQRDP